MLTERVKTLEDEGVALTTRFVLYAGARARIMIWGVSSSFIDIAHAMNGSGQWPINDKLR